MREGDVFETVSLFHMDRYMYTLRKRILVTHIYFISHRGKRVQ